MQTHKKLVRTPSKIRQHVHGMVRCSHAQSPTRCGWWVIPRGHKHSCDHELTQRIRYHGAHSGLHTPQHWIRKHKNSTEHTITAGLRMNAYIEYAHNVFFSLAKKAPLNVHVQCTTTHSLNLAT